MSGVWVDEDELKRSDVIMAVYYLPSGSEIKKLYLVLRRANAKFTTNPADFFRL